MPTDRLRSLIESELPALVEFRRYLHTVPELSDNEHQTSQIIQRELGKMGIASKAGFGNKGTGVLAHIPPSDPGQSAKPSIALRADIDALPITEATGKPYASTCPGVMHACGHD